jgi:hypothetical protein
MSDRPRRDRLSIAERAARRDYVLSRGRDRFTALLRILQAGREMPLVQRGGYEVDWRSWAWRIGKVVLAVAAVGFAGLFALDLVRDQRVDTWAGPDGSVRSGRHLAGCVEADGLRDEVYPSWVRFSGSVFVLLHVLRPVADPAVGGTGLTESGYSLGQMRLLTEGPAASAPERGRIFLILPPAVAAEVYTVTPECA